MFCDEHGTQDYCGECIAESLEARIKELEAKYNELLYAVETKQPNMTRHETALHYIQSRERGCQLGQAINTQEEGHIGPPCDQECWKYFHMTGGKHMVHCAVTKYLNTQEEG